MGSWFAISDVTVPLKMSTPFRFTVISDHHAGAGGQSLDKARKAIQKAMGKRPDATFLLRDFVHGRKAVPRIELALKGIKAPLGVYAVLGNHDRVECLSSCIFPSASRR